MGVLTTITIYNDGLYDIKEHPVEFAEAVMKAMSNYVPDSYAVGSHANLITAQVPKHADNSTVYVHMGNTVVEMNAFSTYTQKLMERNPEFAEQLINEIEFQARKLRKKFEDHKIAAKKAKNGDVI